MKPVYQTRFGGSEAPPGEQGDCLAACLATVFETSLEEAPEMPPYLGDDDDMRWWDTMEAWCMERGVLPFHVLVEDGPLPLTYYILLVQSPSLPPPDGHAIVARGKEIVHDPNATRSPRKWDEYEKRGAIFFVKWWPID